MDSQKYENLNQFIDKQKLEVLNVDSQDNINQIILNGKSNLVKSDADQQILINIGFNRTVKIHHIVIKSDSLDSQPKVIKLFVNRLGVDFDSAANDDCTQQVELADNQQTIELKYVKFQKVDDLCVFIEDSVDGEMTSLNGFSIYGQSTETTDMNNFKKVGNDDN